MIRSLLASAALCAALALSTGSAGAASIVDEWSTVKAPTPPPLQAVHVDSATTALLMLDFVKQICNGPRCLAAVPKVANLLKAARAGHMTVVYSYVFGATLADTLPAVAPVTGEASVQSGPDKFIGTDLEKMLAQKGIKTVVVVGTAAHGAVMYTASHAALLGLDVVVPVDGMASEVPYAEQYVVWNFANAPRVSTKVKLTALDQLSF